MFIGVIVVQIQGITDWGPFEAKVLQKKNGINEAHQRVRAVGLTTSGKHKTHRLAFLAFLDRGSFDLDRDQSILRSLSFHRQSSTVITQPHRYSICTPLLTSLIMAAASPTPLPTSRETFTQWPGSRLNMRDHPSRPMLKRGPPLMSVSVAEDRLDSSDDEVPVPPIGFSAEAKAILREEASDLGGSSPSGRTKISTKELSEGAPSISERRSPPSIDAPRRNRVDSPSSQLLGVHRVVRLSPATLGSGGIRRVVSTSTTQPSPAESRKLDLITPAPRPRSVQALVPGVSEGSPKWSDDYRSTKDHAKVYNDGMEPQTVLREGETALSEAVAQIGNLSITRIKGEDTGVQGSIRVKRVGKVAGRYLSGPARRGMKRRQSDEDQSPIPGQALGSGGALHVTTEQEEENEKGGVPQPVHSVSPNPKSTADFEPQAVAISRILEGQGTGASGNHGKQPTFERKSVLVSDDQPQPRPRSPPIALSSQSPEKAVQPVFKVPPLPPLPSRFDQENEPPPTFKRKKPNGLALSEKPQGLSILADRKTSAKTPGIISPLRPALAPRSQNTPLRPPPPPPKMTVLETATAPAGSASASQARKKRNYISVNGKLFTRMDCIGRGGSSKVYRVMAENFKVFALKRVTLEDQDDAAIRGYKGEIDLLKRLENVDRVVRLFDWELNHERQTLSVLMEMGESDLNRVITQKLNVEDANLDITFTRYFWKEMLECVQAVHEHDIVHSDLKPANFLLLQGKLKLIDFGISNAIPDDTVNVSRAQQVGTPNYMAPESLQDFNAASGLPASAGKVMKLGKPSDVWSLGCILYQMVYGKPPFAHITQFQARVLAIINPRHIIEFPDHGVGGIPLASGLLKTLRRCLNRDTSQRPTVADLLGPCDPFMNPEAALLGTVPVSQELLGRIQLNIVRHIRDKGLPDENELATWPARFFASIKAAVEEGRA